MKPGIHYIGITTPFYTTDGKGKFFLAKRSKNARDEHGTWDFGAGQLEFGEDVEKGVLRELQEEYGVVGKILEQLPAHSIHKTFNDIKTHWLAIPHIILVNPEKIKIQEPHKFDDHGWFVLNNLPKPLHTGVKQTLKLYKQIIHKYN